MGVGERRMIIAPITAGVESPITPPAAMTLASTSCTQNLVVLARVAPTWRKTSSSRSISGLWYSLPGSTARSSQFTRPPWLLVS